MTRLPKIWDILQRRMPRETWVSLNQIYAVVEGEGVLDAQDQLPESPTSGGPKWKRNVRNVLQHRRQSQEIQWDGNAHYRLPGQARQSPSSANDRPSARSGRPWQWVETVDQVVDNILRYNQDLPLHVAEARRQIASRDYFVQFGELVAPTKFAACAGADWNKYLWWVQHDSLQGQNADPRIERLGLDKRVVATPEYRAWCQRWGFTPIASPTVWVINQPAEGDASTPSERRRQAGTANKLIRDRRFRDRVLEAYGYQCAVCSINLPQLLEAAHIDPAARVDDDSVDNGICLCVLHHRAYDAGMLLVEGDGRVHTTVDLDLKIERSTLRVPTLPAWRPAPVKLARRRQTVHA